MTTISYIPERDTAYAGQTASPTFSQPNFSGMNASLAALKKQLNQTLVLVGMPGAGKSSIGRKLAAKLALPFFDADTEIENAAGMPIPQIFEQFGEAEFRKGEKRVISRLLEKPAHVLATGGGAFMDTDTHALIKQKAISIWLDVGLDVLLDRISRKNDRPLLQKNNPMVALKTLHSQRLPVYQTADISVVCDDRPTDETVEAVISGLKKHFHIL